MNLQLLMVLGVRAALNDEQPETLISPVYTCASVLQNYKPKTSVLQYLLIV